MNFIFQLSDFFIKTICKIGNEKYYLEIKTNTNKFNIYLAYKHYVLLYLLNFII